MAFDSDRLNRSVMKDATSLSICFNTEVGMGIGSSANDLSGIVIRYIARRMLSMIQGAG